MNEQDNNTNEEQEQPKRRRFSGIFDSSPDDDFDSNGTSDFRETDTNEPEREEIREAIETPAEKRHINHWQVLIDAGLATRHETDGDEHRQGQVWYTTLMDKAWEHPFAGISKTYRRKYDFGGFIGHEQPYHTVVVINGIVVAERIGNAYGFELRNVRDNIGKKYSTISHLNFTEIKAWV